MHIDLVMQLHALKLPDVLTMYLDRIGACEYVLIHPLRHIHSTRVAYPGLVCMSTVIYDHAKSFLKITIPPEKPNPHKTPRARKDLINAGRNTDW